MLIIRSINNFMLMFVIIILSSCSLQNFKQKKIGKLNEVLPKITILEFDILLMM